MPDGRPGLTLQFTIDEWRKLHAVADAEGISVGRLVKGWVLFEIQEPPLPTGIVATGNYEDGARIDPGERVWRSADSRFVRGRVPT